MNDYEKNAIEELCKHAECRIRDYQEFQEDDSIEEVDLIVCTEVGTMTFVVKSKGIMYEVGYEEFALMQYCTENKNKWTEKIQWLPCEHWLNQSEDYTRIDLKSSGYLMNTG